MKNVWKIFGMAYVAVCGMLLFGANAKAYIDPSVATYAIQAVGIYFRRAKKKINEKLGVDENKNKEVESDDIIVK